MTLTSNPFPDPQVLLAAGLSDLAALAAPDGPSEAKPAVRASQSVHTALTLRPDSNRHPELPASMPGGRRLSRAYARSMAARKVAGDGRLCRKCCHARSAAWLGCT